MQARKKKEQEQNRLLIILILCAVLPPVGMLLLWRGRYSAKGKLCITLLSTACLTLILTAILHMRPPVVIEMPTMSAASYAQQQALQEEILIAPANPNG